MVKGILQTYERASGQKVNFQKSAICFSRNTKRITQVQLDTIFGVEWVDKQERYLRLPTLFGKNRRACFSHIKERLWKKLQSWKGKCFSVAGKELLIKVVAQAIPLYSMNCFLLPKYFCDELHQLIASYWWTETENLRKIHQMAWDRLCFPKNEGGLGFRKLYAFNLGFLAKQG